MSVVTEVVLLAYPTSTEEEAAILSHDFETRTDHHHGQHLKMHDANHAGGPKYASWKVFQAAFNHVGRQQVLDWYAKIAANMPTVGLILMVDDEGLEPAIYPNIYTANLEEV